MKKILKVIERAIKIYSDCIIMGILPFLDDSDYCLFKIKRNFYLCKVDTDKLYNAMYGSQHWLIHKNLHNFVTIIDHFKQEGTLKQTIRKHFDLEYAYLNFQNGVKVFNTYYKKDHSIQITPVCLKGKLLVQGSWILLDELFKQNYI